MSFDPGDNKSKYYINLISRRGAYGLEYSWDKRGWQWQRPFDALTYSTNLLQTTPGADVITYVWNGKTSERAFVSGSGSHIGRQPGETTMAHVRAHPQGICFKTCFYREGHLLHAVTTMVKDGDCEVFKASVDMRPIARAIARYHARLHTRGTEVGSIFGSISHAVSSVSHAVSHAASSVAHSQLVNAIGKQVKSAVKSKITGGIIAATAVVFPPVGVPAAAAYATANAALALVDNGKKVADKVRAIATTGSDAAKARAHSLIGQIQESQKKKVLAQTWLRGVLTDGEKLKAQAAAERNPFKKALLLRQAALPSKIINIVAAQRAALEARTGGKTPPAGSIPALLITDEGRIVKGHYLMQNANNAIKRATLYHGGQTLDGKFAKVGADMGGMGGMVPNPSVLPAWAR